LIHRKRRNGTYGAARPAETGCNLNLIAASEQWELLTSIDAAWSEFRRMESENLVAGCDSCELGGINGLGGAVMVPCALRLDGEFIV